MNFAIGTHALNTINLSFGSLATFLGTLFGLFVTEVFRQIFVEQVFKSVVLK